MNEMQRKLLDKGIVVLPETIEHDTYEYVLEALLERDGQQVWLYCKGDGGDSRSALAMVDLIGLHGDVVGLLVGEANSSHVTVWASCQTRYVSPHGGIGVHKVAWSSFDGRADSHNMRLMADQFDSTEAKTARVLEAASNKGWDWWLKLIQQTGSSGVRQFDAEAIIRMGMARPMGEFVFEIEHGFIPGMQGKYDGPRPKPEIMPEWFKPTSGYSPQGEKVENGFLNALGALKDEPMVTPAQIETLKGLGYAVDHVASFTVNGVTPPTGWSAMRSWDDSDGGHVALIGSVSLFDDGWVLAWQDAMARGLVEPSTEDSPRGESDLDARLKRGGAQFQYGE